MVEGIASQKEEELMGGIMNAVRRGESLDQARATLLNAGYPANLVDMAISRVSGGESQFTSSAPVVETKKKNIDVPASNLQLYATHSRPTVSQPQVHSNPTPQRQQQFGVQRRRRLPVPYWAVVLMLLLGVGIIVGAGVLGLYWHQLFPG